MDELSKKNKETFEFVQFIIRHFKVFLVSTLSAVLFSIIVTFFIPKEYLSVGIVFPTSSASLQAALDNPMLGYDVDADRLMQIMESREMFDILTKKFNLIQHYDIDTTSIDWYEKLRKAFDAGITFKRKQSMAIEIKAQTTDPVLSANIVNTIIENVDNIRERIIKQNLLLAYTSFAEEYNQKKKQLDSLVVLISGMRDTLKGPQFSIIMDSKMLNYSMPNYSNKNTTQLELSINKYYYEQSRLNDINSKYEKAKVLAFGYIPRIYTLDRARISYKKVFPSYSLNALIAFFGIFILAFFTLFIKEKSNAPK